MDAYVPYSISIEDGAKQCNQGEQKMPFPAKHDKRHNGGEKIEDDEKVHIKYYLLVFVVQR